MALTSVQLSLLNFSSPVKTRQAEQIIPMHPDGKCLADNILFRNRTPDPAVTAVVAVVAHHEVMARWHDHRNPAPEATRNPMFANQVRLALDTFLYNIIAVTGKTGAGKSLLLDFFAIHEQLVVEQLHMVTGQANHPLDKIARII